MRLLFFLFFLSTSLFAEVTPGIENLFSQKHVEKIKGKQVALITNQTGVTRKMVPTLEFLVSKEKDHQFKVAAIFAPEHGFTGIGYSWEHLHDHSSKNGIPVYNLHGRTTRPTDEMLKDIDLIIYDIQDVGCRSYTCINTLFYVMEEAAKKKVPVIVADRPNPINGIVVDGPMLDSKWRSIVGYINVPYCHGMTIGELAQLFNKEYKVGCQLSVVPMEGWKRSMTYSDTKLPWIPTSPNIPEPTTPYFYPMTGILGELQVASIGIGYTLPFKLVGAPWIQAESFADQLNKQDLPGVRFQPFHFKPFFGRFKGEQCQGVMIVVTDHKKIKPVTTQYVIIGLLKSLYPKEFDKAFKASKSRERMFAQVNGTDEVYNLLRDKPYVTWELRAFQQKEREAFGKTRKQYLIASYGN